MLRWMLFFAGWLWCMGAWGQARVEGYVCSEEGVPVADAAGAGIP